LKITSLDISIIHNDSGNIILRQEQSGIRVYGQGLEKFMEGEGNKMLGTHSPDLKLFICGRVLSCQEFFG